MLDYQKDLEKRITINNNYIKNGVEFIDKSQVYIKGNVKIGKGTVIYPCVVIEGDVTIGENCILGQNSRIIDSTIGDGVSIQSSHILESSVGGGTSVGPFAYIRPNSKIGIGCKIGDFVEVKNSTLGDGSKASHLSYIGDSDVGNGVNIGCGVVFVNYDGKNKHRSNVGSDSFIGCNVNLVSPVSVGDKSYIAAGSTVTGDVPSGALCVARSREEVKPGWVEKKGLLSEKK